LAHLRLDDRRGMHESEVKDDNGADHRFVSGNGGF
jgi:hypothetical protein